MKEKKSKRFWSIRHKLSLIIVLITLGALLAYFAFFQSYTYQASIERYRYQTAPLRDTLVNTIDYYINTCVKAARSIYFNSPVIQRLTSASGQYANSETGDSQALFAYMLSVYASVPSARQVRLAAYKLERSFLVTTYDIVRYMDLRPGVTFASEYPDNAFTSVNRSIWVESTHPIGAYGHFVQQAANRSQNVFTVHVPIFMLPDTKETIGLLSVDIAAQYIEMNCGFAKGIGADVFIADQMGEIVYAEDGGLIGKPLYGAEGEPLWFSPDAPETGDYAKEGYLVTTGGGFSDVVPWQLYIVTPLRHITRDALVTNYVLMFVFALYLVGITVILLGVLLRYISPLSLTATFIRANYYRGRYNLKARLHDRIHYSANDEVGVLVESIDAMLDTIDRFVVRQYKMLLATRTAELRTLQAQINPHFIYNTLQCLASKCLERNDVESYDYIASFGQLLQYAMDLGENAATLRQEAEHMKRYLMLQSIRYQSVVDLVVTADDQAQRAAIPRMSLQPLAENSVMHGKLCQMPEGRIILNAAVEGEWLLLEVRDNGIPVEMEKSSRITERLQRMREDYAYLREAAIPDASVENILPVEQEGGATRQGSNLAVKGERIGLSNVFMRFLLMFGPECNFTIEPNDMKGTTIRLKCPYHLAESGSSIGKVNQ